MRFKQDEVCERKGVSRISGAKMSYDRRLKELRIELPQPPKPVATYIPGVRVGDLLFLSGVLPMQDGQLAFSGKLGRDLTVEQGMEAAKIAVSAPTMATVFIAVGASTKIAFERATMLFAVLVLAMLLAIKK